MSFDLLLDWVSESGSGSWDAFKQAHEWLRRSGLWVSYTGPTGAARSLATLGHVEVDWLNRRWAVAPSVITILPDAGGHALLCGARTRTLQSRLDSLVDATQEIWRPPPANQAGGPCPVYLQVDDETVVEALASDLGIRYEYSIAHRIAELLPPLDSYLDIAVAQPAPPHEEAEAFDPVRLSWLATARTDGPGAYRYKVYGAPVYRYRSTAGSVHRMDQDLSVYAVLRDAQRSVLSWYPASVNGTLGVKQGAALPMLHGRAAAMCSGLAPIFDVHERAHKFVNVPLGVANKIAASLGQTLDVRGEPRTVPRASARPAGPRP